MSAGLAPARSAQRFGSAWNGLGQALRLSPAHAYVLRTVLAMAIAFYAALWLQLATPASSAVTVMIVANLSRGGIVSKGVWRIFGTLTGAVAAVVIMAWFGQSSILFIVAFGFWLGLCTFASSMFRHFRAYGAVLSGYTVALIAIGAIPKPDHVLDYALARLAVVTLGVVVSTLVTMIFQATVTTDSMRVRSRAALRGVANLLLSRADGTPMDDPAFVAERTRLAGEIERLDEAIEFAGAEAPDVSRHAASLRRGLAALYAALLSVSVAGQSLNTLAGIETARRREAAEQNTDLDDHAIVERVRGLLREVAAYDPHTDQDSVVMAEKIAAIAREVTALQSAVVTLDEATTLARIHQELEQLYDCMAPFANWRARQRPYHRGGTLTAFKDYGTARRNGTRSMIAVVLGGLFAYVTAWPQGPTLLLILAASCALLSGAPSAAAASLQFAKGITLSTVVAFIWEFCVLPHLNGYPMLFLSITPVLLVAVYYTIIPKYGLMALGFVIFFITQLNLADLMTYDILSFANGGIAFVLGAWGTVLVFRVILPPNPMRDASYLTRRIRRAAEQLIARSAHPQRRRDWLGWLVTYNQAMQRLFLRLQVNPGLRNRSIGDSGALLIVTQEAIRLQSLLRGMTLPAAEAAETTLALRNLTCLRQPRRAAASAEKASASLAALHAAATEPRPGLLRVAAGFRTIAALMPQVEHLLALEAPLPKDA
ncbi:FUSC family protein [Acidisoma silvae]|uniref:FUSC family protein n=1 Tax=Acidisoma silvae TaxID=2802396 RepID=A0A963YSA7_9PROT|nr:FUSC family protein [Acidisoma silvae]MCB8876021.1 FUSC family protein [Acidisoma silvae]